MEKILFSTRCGSKQVPCALSYWPQLMRYHSVSCFYLFQHKGWSLKIYFTFLSHSQSVSDLAMCYTHISRCIKSSNCVIGNNFLSCLLSCFSNAHRQRLSKVVNFWHVFLDTVVPNSILKMGCEIAWLSRLYIYCVFHWGSECLSCWDACKMWHMHEGKFLAYGSSPLLLNKSLNALSRTDWWIPGLQE